MKNWKYSTGCMKKGNSRLNDILFTINIGTWSNVSTKRIAAVLYRNVENCLRMNKEWPRVAVSFKLAGSCLNRGSAD